MAFLIFVAMLISLPLLCTSTHTTYVPPSLVAKPIAPPAGWAEQEIAKYTRVLLFIFIVPLFVLKSAKADPQVLFHDDFNTINPLIWQHDITMTGGGYGSDLFDTHLGAH